MENPCVFLNRLANSAASFRPLRHSFEYETPSQTTAEVGRLVEEMESAEFSFIFRTDLFPGLEIDFQGHLSMIDQKVLGVIAKERACCNCPVCGATPTIIKNNDVTKFVVKFEKLLDFGMSSLHFWIRVFENLCNIGFRRLEV
jgi:hypothetical protein